MKRYIGCIVREVLVHLEWYRSQYPKASIVQFELRIKLLSSKSLQLELRQISLFQVFLEHSSFVNQIVPEALEHSALLTRIPGTLNLT